MRVALISDLHANLVALDAVLADIERRRCDRIVCLGDVATLGPQPHEVLARIKELGCPCIVGNHDEFLLDAELIRRYTEAPIIVDSVDWCRNQMRPDELDFVRSFVKTLELPGDIFLYHGSPRSHMEDILADTPAERVDEMLDGKRARILAGGHTHLQMLRQHRGMWLVNPRSVGAPFLEYPNGKTPVILAYAEYAILEDDGVMLCRVDIDREALLASLRNSSLPLAPALMAQYTKPQALPSPAT